MRIGCRCRVSISTALRKSGDNGLENRCGLDSARSSVLPTNGRRVRMVFSESRLVERFRSGDESALAAVYRACVDEVTRIAQLVLRACASSGARSRSEVAAALPDVVQEVFVKAFAPEARHRFDPTRPYEPYLAQIARNVAVDYWRQMRRYVPSDLDHLIERLSLEAETDRVAAHTWTDSETIAVVEHYLASLDEQSRRIHDALYVKGLSQREAAELLGLGRQVVRTKEAKLRRGLRRELSRAAGVGALPLRVSKQSG
jgi:RNA polymerase sigma factor (sigma-70 family)